MSEKKDVMMMQDNVLTESRYDFTRIEKNCLYKIIEKVRLDYIEQPNTQTIEEYHDMTVYLYPNVLEDITDKAHRKQAHDALVSLRKRDVEIHWKNGSWLNCGFVNWCEYDADNKIYKVEVSKRIMPYLVDLARCYTTYSLTVAITLKSTYSQRFYELCCQYYNWVEADGIPGFHKTQKQLREMFCLEDKYTDNYDFNRRVVKAAQKEIKKLYDAGQCYLYFDVNIKGKGADMHYDFKVHTKEQSEAQKKAFADIRQRWLYIQRELMGIFPKDLKFVERIMKELDFNPNLVDKVFSKVEKVKVDYSGSDRAKLLRFIFKEDFNIK